MRPTSVKVTLSYDRTEFWRQLEDSGSFVAVERGGIASLLFLEFSGDPSPETRQRLIQGVREAWPQMDPTATAGAVVDGSEARVKFHLLPEEVIVHVLAIQVKQQLGQ